MFDLNTGRGATQARPEFSKAQKSVLTDVIESVVNTVKRSQAIFNDVSDVSGTELSF